ncbi:tail sheath protein [Humitalea rosea]|uniref:Tail sheath protein n=1 Tax=Humitalea rosea TaxID=990373 RepID=A0A2W7IIY9_9PROT|nr:tape measure protein [Humitalea rosea]PZW46850.1 tail sheath protein [Humitalea rosea]
MSASVSFNAIPLSIRVPGTYVEISNTRAIRGLTKWPARVMLLGQMLSTGTAAANVPIQITSATMARTAFGRGSMLAHLFAAWFGNTLTTEVWAIPMVDAVAGVAATGTVTAVGTATAPGTIPLLVGGRRVEVGVTTGDTAAAVATAVSAAIAASLDLPLTASVLSAAVTLTAKHKGTCGNSIDVRHSFYPGEALPAGITLTIVPMAGGVTNPTVQTALDAIGDTWFTDFVTPWTDAPNLVALEAKLAGDFGPLAMRDAHGWAALSGTFSALTTFGAGRNSPQLTVLADRGSPTRAREATSAIAGLAARTAAIGAGLGIAAGAAVNRNIIGVAASFERYQLTLQTVMGSQAAAEQALAWVSDFARTTPFELGEATQAFVSLRTMGIDPTTGLLRQLGDAAAIRSTSLADVTTAFSAALRGEMDPLERFGIMARTEGDRITLNWQANGQEMRASVDKTNRALLSRRIGDALGQMYGGGMAQLATSWDGQLSNLSDAWARFGLLVGNAGFFDLMKQQLSDLLAWLGRLEADGSLTRWATQISEVLSGVVRGLRDLVTGTDETPPLLTRLGNAFETVSDIIRPIVTRFGGIETAIAVFAVVAGGPILAALASLTGAVVLLGAALLTTPLGWFLGAVALIAGAAAAIYANWDGLVAWSAGLWTRFRSGLEPQMAEISAIVDGAFAGAARLARAAWDRLGSGLTTILDGIGAAFTWTMERIRSVLDWLRDAVEPLRAAWEPLETFFTGLWGGVADALDGAWRRILPVIDWLRDAVAPLRAAWEPLAAFFSGLWGGVADALDTAWGRIRPIVDALRSAAEFFGRDTPAAAPGQEPALGQVGRRGRARGAQRIEGFDEEDGAPAGTAPGGLPPPPATAGGGVPPPPAGAAREPVRVDTGGTLRIQVEDGRVGVSGRPNDPTQMRWDRGPSLVTP